MMEFVERKFVRNILEEHATEGYADDKAGDIEESVSFILEQETERGLEVII